MAHRDKGTQKIRGRNREKTRSVWGQPHRASHKSKIGSRHQALCQTQSTHYHNFFGSSSQVVNAIHSYGGLVFHDIIKKRHAEKAQEAGVDGLILVAAGAGGHAGTINPMTLVAEIKKFFGKTIILSGCISTGRDIASALQMGADLAYMGTRFINTDEAKAPEEYKQMIIDAGANDVVYTAAISGVHANFFGASLKAAGLTEEDLKKTKNRFW